jgi:23S rRNA pseudouridine2605 synthase
VGILPSYPPTFRIRHSQPSAQILDFPNSALWTVDGIMLIRLQKYLAEAGVASRRVGEEFIRSGRVAVNGETVQELGTKVETGHDQVTVDGQPIKAKRRMYLALNKPPGLVCSKKDELGRSTIYELLPKEWGHLNSVGRLDYNSEGLIFLTNDGEFSLRLTHPRYGVHKKYLATVEGRVADQMLQRFERGIWYEGEKFKAERARLISASQSQSVVELDLAEGKYREVRRLFESQSYRVKRLQRVQIGKIKLGELRPGKWRTLTEPEIKSLLS